jgi:predicted O-methyltransferase YrrM
MYRCSKTDAAAYLPCLTLDEIVGPLSTEFIITRPPDWSGSMTITEISSLCHLIVASQPLKILEIGSFRGLTTLNMAMNAPQAEIHTLDLPPEADGCATRFKTNDVNIINSRGSYHYENRTEAARVLQHYGDTALFDYNEIGPAVDFCLIDAAHSYEYVRNDTAKVLPLMADGSFLLWHD